MDGQGEREGGSKVQTARARSNCETCVLPAESPRCQNLHTGSSWFLLQILDLDHLRSSNSAMTWSCPRGLTGAHPRPINIHQYTINIHQYTINIHHQDFHGFSWIFMDFHGFSWIFMDFHGCSTKKKHPKKTIQLYPAIGAAPNFPMPWGFPGEPRRVGGSPCASGKGGENRERPHGRKIFSVDWSPTIIPMEYDAHGFWYCFERILWILLRFWWILILNLWFHNGFNKISTMFGFYRVSLSLFRAHPAVNTYHDLSEASYHLMFPAGDQFWTFSVMIVHFYSQNLAESCRGVRRFHGDIEIHIHIYTHILCIYIYMYWLM